jgi:hypothetical protein
MMSGNGILTATADLFDTTQSAARYPDFIRPKFDVLVRWLWSCPETWRVAVWAEIASGSARNAMAMHEVFEVFINSYHNNHYPNQSYINGDEHD